MFGLIGKSKKAYKAAAEAIGLKLDEKDREIERLRIERDFWVEQGRSLQNQVQTWQRLYAGLLQHIERGGCDESLKAELENMREELSRPVVGVEAVRALTAMMQGGTQGEYTAVSGGRGTAPTLPGKAAKEISEK